MINRAFTFASQILTKNLKLILNFIIILILNIPLNNNYPLSIIF